LNNGIGQNQLRDKIVTRLVKIAEEICQSVITFENKQYDHLDRKIDKILTSRVFGIPVMLAMLGVIFWITITGANYPSQMLSTLFFWIEERLTDFFVWAKAPKWLYGLLVTGAYRTLAWVVSVCCLRWPYSSHCLLCSKTWGIFPELLLTLTISLRKLALTATISDHVHGFWLQCRRSHWMPNNRLTARKADSHNYQQFCTLQRSFPNSDCNNNHVLCGKFCRFFSIGAFNALLTGVILLGIVMTLLVSKLLSKTILKGLPSSFALELPPYRKPQIGRIIVRSIFDRTLFVLGRAVSVAIPAGFVIWIMANIYVGEQSLLSLCAGSSIPLPD